MVRVDVRNEAAVGEGDDAGDVAVSQRQRAEVGAGRRHERGGADAVPADVADGQAETAVSQGQVVEEIATRFLGGARGACQSESDRRGRGLGEEPLLDPPRHLKLP